MMDVLEALGTPRDRQHRALRKALEARRDEFAHAHAAEGYEYDGAGDLLLRHGTFFSGRELPADYLALKGVPGRCFLNALEAVRADPTLTYMEGVYAIGDSHWTPHAWCLDPAGELLEVSLPTDEATIAVGRSHGGRLPILGLEHWSYWGVALHPDLVEEVVEAQDGSYGVLDRPSQDALDGNPHTQEWREEWPFLRLSYDPDRRTLAS